MALFFTVVGQASPDLPLRILNLFAQQGVMVDEVQLARKEARYELRVALADLCPTRAQIIQQKMGAMVLVETAELTFAPSSALGRER